MKKMLLCGLSAVVLLTSCVKKKETPTGDAHIRFVNAVIDAPAHDVYINDDKVSSGVLAFGVVTPYKTYTAGISLMAFVDPGTNKTSAAENYGSDIGDYATLYFYQGMDGYLTAGGIKDDMAAPSAGKAKVRFINLDYNLIEALTITPSTGAAYFNQLPFATASKYFEVAPGTTFTASAATVTTAPVINPNVQAGKIYTIWLSGPSTSEINGHIILQN